MQTEMPAPQAQKPSIFNAVNIVLILLFLVMAGLGVAGFVLNNNLSATQAAQAGLQARYDDLSGQTGKLQTDLDAAQADLQKTNTDQQTADKALMDAKASLSSTQASLTKTQSDLDKANKDLKTLQEKLAKALKYIDLGREAFSMEENNQIEQKIKAINDPTLSEKYTKFTLGHRESDFKEWGHYLFSTIVGLLK